MLCSEFCFCEVGKRVFYFYSEYLTVSEGLKSLEQNT